MHAVHVKRFSMLDICSVKPKLNTGKTWNLKKHAKKKKRGAGHMAAACYTRNQSLASQSQAPCVWIVLTAAPEGPQNTK